MSEKDYSWNPDDPAEQAAKDQIFTMFESRFVEINEIARANAGLLREMFAKDGHMVQSFRFFAQIILTEIEGRKIRTGIAWPPAQSQGIPLSPGWKFLLKMIQSPNKPMTEEDSLVQAAKCFTAILHEALANAMEGKATLLEGIQKVKPRVKEEMKAQIDGGAIASLDVVKHLSNWVWVMDQPAALEAMATRLQQLVADPDRGGSLDFEGVVTLQKELAKYRASGDMFELEDDDEA